MPPRWQNAATLRAGTLAPLLSVGRDVRAWVTGNGIYRMGVMTMIKAANAFVARLRPRHRRSATKNSLRQPSRWS